MVFIGPLKQQLPCHRVTGFLLLLVSPDAEFHTKRNTNVSCFLVLILFLTLFLVVHSLHTDVHDKKKQCSTVQRW